MIRKTPLYQNHLDLGAKMGEFAGYDMPLYYGEGVIKEHEWVRSSCGVFDVSHMGQILVSGNHAAEFWERLTPSAFQAKANGRCQYSVMLNEDGGIIDDLIVARLSENSFFAVINAGCKDKDINWIQSQLPDTLTFEILDDNALIAIQGAEAERVLLDIMKVDAADMPYMHMIDAVSPCGRPIYVSRLGYTGEDGFELSVPNDIASNVWNAFVGHDAVKPIGLAARDSLRLEMGYPLYGHDIDASTSPVEADLGWIVSKKTTGYFGYDRIQNELMSGLSRKRVGIQLTGKGVAREGAELRDHGDNKIGVVTSGTHSPTLKCSIAMGYIDPNFSQIGAGLNVNVRGRNIAAKIVSMPFVPAKTKSLKKKHAV